MICMPKVLNYRVIIEKDEDGVFVASVPSLQGCHTQGDTYEETLERIKEAIELSLEARKAHHELVDDSEMELVGVTNVSVPYGSFACS